MKIRATIVFVLILILMGGCSMTDQEEKPIWKKYEDAQYNSFKPRLDYMIKKYEEEFTMSVYGTVSSVEHPDWNIWIDWNDKEKEYTDNYIVLRRSSELEKIMLDILEPIYGECKVYALSTGTAPAETDKNTTAEELLTGDSCCVQIRFFVNKDPQSKTEDFKRLIDTLSEKHYKVEITMLYVDEDGLNEITRENHNRSFFGDESRYSWRTQTRVEGIFEWKENDWREGGL